LNANNFFRMKMRSRVFFALFLVITTISLTGCEGLFDNCKVCRLNSWENGAIIGSNSEAEYCDSKLFTIQTTPDVVDNNITYRWDCD